jgi:hypothetical protein
MSSRRTARLLGAVAALVTVLELVTPTSGMAATAAPDATQGFMTAVVPASAATGTGSGGNFCATVSGVVNGATVQSYNLGPSYQNVYSCGPTQETGWNNDPFESDWQCVELSTRFMWAEYGLRAAPGNGSVFVANNHARFPSIAVGRPSPGNLPAPGDVVSMGGGAANPNASPWGHTAVVSDVSHVDRSTGNGYIKLIEENDGGVGAGRINVSNWNESDGNPQYANGLYWYTDISWLVLAQDPTSAPGASTAMRVCTTCAPPLQHHGGPVMGASAPGDNTVASLYWSPSGAAYSTGYQGILDGYLGNVASNSAAGDVFAANPQYGDSTPTTSPFHFGGRLSDGSPLPGSGCAPDAGYGTCLSDAQIQAELAHVIATQGPPIGLGHVYVLFLPPGVEACSGLGSCSGSQFCGYHDNLPSADGTVLYAVVPYPTASGVCTTGQAPNGDVVADGAVDTVSRLLSEVISDPLGNAWTDASGNEIGAQCVNGYGAPLGSTAAARAQTTEYNQVIGSGRYYTQEEFSNSAFRATGSGCSQRSGASAAAAANTVAVSATSSQVANDGAATSTVTVTVLSSQHLPVSGAAVHLSTYTRSGTCGTVNPIDVATDANGHATTVFTASTQDATCSVVANEAASGRSGRTVIVQGVAGVYHALAPVRVADSRPGSGLSLAGQTFGSGQSQSLPIANTHGVPADATAVVLNVTTTNSTSPSYVTVYPSGTPLPLTSNLNFDAGQTTANLVTVPVGASGAVSIFNYAGSTDVIADLEGYMEAGSGPSGLFKPAAPFRITDTRAGSGQANAGSALHGASTLTVKVGGVGTVPVAGAAAVVLNITAVDGDTGSYLTAYPSDSTRPVASSVNFLPGQVVPNRVIVPLAKDGTISLYNLAGTVDAIVDVSGWFTDASNAQATGLRFTPVAPVRVVDTRPGAGQPLAGQTLQPQGAATSPVATTASLPAQAAAIAANVTTTGTTSASFLSVFPAGTATPASSDLNWAPGETTSNMLVTGVGGGSAVTLYNLLGQADVIVDICGFWS